MIDILNQLYPNLQDIVSFNSNFYRRSSYWYEPIILELEIKRVSHFLLKLGKPPIQAKTVLKNLEALTLVSAQNVNPPGYFPCINGVLKWEWQGKKLHFDFIPADQARQLDVVFLGKPNFEYNPSADDRHLNTLLECLDEPFREILLRTVACALDLRAIRRFHSRIPRALLLHGTGANGKDALRTILFRLLPNCSSVSIADFQAYDAGRKFPLADLEISRLNWASENAQLKKLDTIESLKLLVSGDPISIERKGVQEYRVVPQVVLLFNTNSTPKILASTPAIKTRYAIIPFTKTYVANPDPAKNELRADPRFKDDFDFIDKNILPPLFNLLLSKLQQVAFEGINYDPTLTVLEQARANSSHLVQFCEDVGLVEDPDGIVFVVDIYKLLEDWYIREGFLIVETGPRGGIRKIWENSTGDKCVQASHQLFGRLQELFPNIKRKVFRYTDEKGEHKKIAIHGLNLTQKTGFRGFQDFQSPYSSDFQETQQGSGRVPSSDEVQVQGSKPEMPMNTASEDKNAVQRNPRNPIFRLQPGDKVVYRGQVPWIKKLFGTEPATVVSHVNDCLYLKNPSGGMDVPVLSDGWEVWSDAV